MIEVTYNLKINSKLARKNVSFWKHHGNIILQDTDILPSKHVLN